MDEPEKTHAQLKTAFPWFDDEAWAWHYEPATKDGVPIDAPDADGGVLGKIAIYMPGASSEQYETVKAWLMGHFNPARLVPGPEFVGEFASVAGDPGRSKGLRDAK
jgi:hypothetical protein